MAGKWRDYNPRARHLGPVSPLKMSRRGGTRKRNERGNETQVGGICRVQMTGVHATVP